MPSFFDMTRGDWTLLAITLLLVVLPSAVPPISNALGRLLIKPKKT